VHQHQVAGEIEGVRSEPARHTDRGPQKASTHRKPLLSQARSLIERLSPAARGSISAIPHFDKAVLAGMHQAKTQWPEVRCSLRGFLEYLGERIAEHGASTRPFQLDHTADLLLAYACSQGKGAALLVFERDFLPRAMSRVARLKIRGDEAEEVRQLMLDRLDRLTWQETRSQDSSANELHLVHRPARCEPFIQELRGILAKLEAAYANH